MRQHNQVIHEYAINNPANIPFACFRFDGSVYNMEKQEFDKAITEGLKCGCSGCFDCRAAEYARDNNYTVEGGKCSK